LVIGEYFKLNSRLQCKSLCLPFDVLGSEPKLIESLFSNKIGGAVSPPRLSTGDGRLAVVTSLSMFSVFGTDLAGLASGTGGREEELAAPWSDLAE
jgi:hypothetical protein